MKILTIFCKIGKAITLFFCLILILQPLFADWQALNADAGQAGAWAMLYRYGSIGVVGLWTACLLIPRRVVRRLPDVASFVLMGCVIWEAVVALNQLYGDGMSNHALYRFTGTFLNPGPFSGFLAIGVPLAVNYLLVNKGRVDKLTRIDSVDKLTRYKLTRPSGTKSSSTRQLVNSSTIASLICQLKNGLALTTLVLCLLLLPAGMSRSAWGAAAVGGTAVYGMHRWKECLTWGRNIFRSRKRMVAVCVGIATLTLTGWGVFHLKEDSANGRLMIWKMACHAIAERPWTGYGSEGFAAAYAEAQEHYFAEGRGTEEEIHVAGTPDHAFNEYLTVAVRYGLLGLGVMLAIGITAFVCALHGRAYGIAGALVTVGVFAFSSYPFQLPDFLSAVILLVAVPLCFFFRHGLHELQKSCVLTSHRRVSKIPYEIVAIIFVILCLYIVSKGFVQTKYWQARYDAAKEWRNARSLYHMEAYSLVCEDYAPLYERMRWNHNYLFEYGRALHQTERYEESNRILQEAERICGDPMILNIQGKNYEALGTYDQAARLYQRAYNRLPNRLYPLYLEMEMYASPQCNRLDAAKEIARRILDTKEKIPSQAVEEMKERAREVMKMHRQGRHISPLPMHYNFASLL